jgi:hypothetical protein
MVGLVGTIGLPRGRERRRERLRELREGRREGASARVWTRVAAVLLALLAVQLGSLAAPAYACGCGALVPGGGQQVTVGREVSLVRWDGRQEQIVMRLTVAGDAERAAWIMPVPRRATVELGDAELLDQLAAATAPVHRSRSYFWPRDGDWPLTSGDGTGRPPFPPPGRARAEVGVVGRERLGPFDVARLTATDPAALDAWLSSNDFSFPSRLETALRPYVSRRWEYVAVKLAPETSGTALDGDLDPLHLTFAADAPVYPMRLSRLAATPQSLGLYVLAAHRMEPASRIGGERPRVTFAGRIGTATKGTLGEMAAGTPFLTAVAQEFPQPAAISGDHELRRAATDATFRQVIYEDRLLRLLGVPAWLLTTAGALTTLTATAIALALRKGRTDRPPHPGPHPGPRPTRPRPRHASGRQTGAGAPAGAVPGAGAYAGAVPGAAPEAVPGAGAGAVSGAGPGPAPGAASDARLRAAPGAIPGAGPAAAPGAAPGAGPEAAPSTRPTAASGAVPGVRPEVPVEPSVPPAAPARSPSARGVPPGSSVVPPRPSAPPVPRIPPRPSRPPVPVPPRPEAAPHTPVPPRPEAAPSVGPKPFTLPVMRPEPNG